MKKIFISSIEKGSTFVLDEDMSAWIFSCKVGKTEKYPTQFKICEKTLNGYLCQGECEKSKKIFNASDDALKYLIGIKQENFDEKVAFESYLPEVKERILISDYRNNAIIPAQLLLEREYDIYGVPSIELLLIDLLSENVLNLESQKHNFWKYLNSSEDGMNDIEKMYKDTFIHKDFVIDVCDKFAIYLKEKGCYHDAIELKKRSIVHDNSKLKNPEEFKALTSIVSDKSCLENASVPLSTLKQNSIMLHWKNNSHHPEHFDNYEEMSKVDRMEMACDWMARSLQYKSNLLEFAKTRQEDRFHFSEAMFEEVYNYCEILVSLYQT